MLSGEKISFTIDQLPDVSKRVLHRNAKTRIFAFYGEMGAGKTTLIKSICKELGAGNEVGSPTYSIVNQYAGSGGLIIYHFDFYRIKKLEEALDIGIEEYFYSNSYCFIEWPEIIEDHLPVSTTKIKITEENGFRFLEFLNEL